MVDNALGEGVANSLRSELDSLRQVDGAMKSNATAFGAGGRHFAKPHVYEFDMLAADEHGKGVEAEVASRLGLFKKLFEHASTALVDRLNSTSTTLHLARGLSGTTLKLQYNEGGGGCFPLHYDNPGPPNRRKVTCLVYLNPKWTDGDGGELVLQQFGGETVVIPPLHDRMVLFFSDRILHRVLPSHKPRYCFTVWIDGVEGSVNTDDDVMLRAKHLRVGEALSQRQDTDPAREQVAAIAMRLRNSPLQRALSRSVYREAYERSLVECQGEGAPCMVEAHRSAVCAAESSPALSQVIEDLRTLSQEQPTRTI